jgi:hypothetical protein
MDLGDRMVGVREQQRDGVFLATFFLEVLPGTNFSLTPAEVSE